MVLSENAFRTSEIRGWGQPGRALRIHNLAVFNFGRFAALGVALLGAALSPGDLFVGCAAAMRAAATRFYAARSAELAAAFPHVARHALALASGVEPPGPLFSKTGAISKGRRIPRKDLTQHQQGAKEGAPESLPGAFRQPTTTEAQ